MQAALKGDWKEGQEKYVSLVDREPDTVEAYIGWLYTKEVTVQDSEEKCLYHERSTRQKVRDSDCSHLHSLKFVKIDTLGDYLGDIRFCNAVIDMMAPMRGCVPAPEAIRWVWKHTMQDCPVRKFIVQTWTETLGSRAPHTIKFMRAEVSRIPKDFLFDLLASREAQHYPQTAELAQTQKPLAEKCKFHKHVDDSDKCL